MYTHVTCAVFNHDGSEIVATYNDDDIFLFDTRHSDGADYVHKYEGHRNSSTGMHYFFSHKPLFILNLNFILYILTYVVLPDKEIKILIIIFW